MQCHTRVTTGVGPEVTHCLPEGAWTHDSRTQRLKDSATADEPAPDHLDPLADVLGTGLVQGWPATALAQVSVHDGVRRTGLAGVGGNERVQLLALQCHRAVRGELGISLLATGALLRRLPGTQQGGHLVELEQAWQPEELLFVGTA